MHYKVHILRSNEASTLLRARRPFDDSNLLIKSRRR